MTSERRRALIERLLSEAEDAVVAGQWDLVSRYAQSVLALDLSRIGFSTEKAWASPLSSGLFFTGLLGVMLVMKGFFYPDTDWGQIDYFSNGMFVVFGVVMIGATIMGAIFLNRATAESTAEADAERVLNRAHAKQAAHYSRLAAEQVQVRERALAAELEYAIWLNMIETGASTRVQGSALLTAVVRFNDLEHVVAHLLMADHWVNVRLTPDGADGGIDVIGDSPPRRVAAQVKHVNTPVGRPVLQQLLGAAQAGGFTDAVLASSGGFAQTVRDLAREQQSSTHLQLWDRPEIIKKIDALDAAAFKAMVSPLVPYLIGKRPA